MGLIAEGRAYRWIAYHLGISKMQSRTSHDVCAADDFVAPMANAGALLASVHFGAESGHHDSPQSLQS